MVIPIFYHVDPSDVRKQTGEFGDRFKEICMDKTEDEIERLVRALTDVANLAGQDSKNWYVFLKRIGARPERLVRFCSDSLISVFNFSVLEIQEPYSHL